MIIGLIPARGSSKSIKNKNIVNLAGKPLIWYTIKTALSCKRIDKVVVTTDSPQISEIAKSFKLEVINRPKNISLDTSPVIEAIKHAVFYLESKGGKINTIVLLQPTSPFRKTKDINTALDLLNKSDTDSVASVCEAEHNPYFVMAKVNAGFLNYPLLKPSKKIANRQEAPKVYRLNGSIYAIKRNIVVNKNSIITGKTRPLVMPSNLSIDIDSPQDLLFAEFLLKNQKL